MKEGILKTLKSIRTDKLVNFMGIAKGLIGEVLALNTGEGEIPDDKGEISKEEKKVLYKEVYFKKNGSVVECIDDVVSITFPDWDVVAIDSSHNIFHVRSTAYDMMVFKT